MQEIARNRSVTANASAIATRAPNANVAKAFPGSRLRRWGLMTALLAGAGLASMTTEARAQAPTLVSIQIDGEFRDWQSVLVNPLNTTRDGDGSRLGCSVANDLDCPVQSTGRDLRLFAWTYDTLHVFFYVVRQGSASNTETFWFYVDGNANGLMESGEKVVRVRYKGSNGDTYTSLYDYEAVAPGGDPMTDASGMADGYTLPGNLDPSALWAEDVPDGGGSSGSTFEARVPWSVLGLPPGTPLMFHVSSSNSSNPSNIASQVDDNLGSLGGAVGTFAFSRVEIGPDNSSTVAGGAPVAYAHRITNTGTRSDTFALQVLSSLDLSIDIFHDTDGDGDGDVLIATDSSGDGDFADPGDRITAGWDPDGDGYPNTLLLAPGETFDIVVEVATSPSQNDVTDVTTVFAFIAPARSIIDTATNTTDIGLVAVIMDQSKNTIVGQPAIYAISACNNGATNTLALTATSSSGMAVSLYADTNCDGLPDALLARDTNGDGTWDQVLGGDTNGDGIPDSGSLSAGECACFVVVIDPGSSPLGTVDVTSVNVSGTSGGSAVAHADLTTTVAKRIELSPDYLLSEGTAKVSGFGKPVYFAHVVTNNGPTADEVVLSATNDLGWPVVFWSDPNGDGSIADGQVITRTGSIAPYGGTWAFVVEVAAAIDASGGTFSTTMVTGVSVSNPADRDTVTDEVELSLIATYRDPLFAFATTFFAPCDTIYVEGTGLERPRPNGRDEYTLIYFDGAGVAVETWPDFVPDPQGAATHEHVISGNEVSGTWRIELQKDGDVVSTITVEVEMSGEFTSLTTDRSAYPMSGADLAVAATLRNGNVEAQFGDTTLEYVVLDPTGSMYLVAGGTASSFAAYGGTETTRSVGLPPMAVDEVFTDLFIAPSVAYPAEGVYTVNATWRASCGTLLATSTRPFVVGSLSENCSNGIDDDGDTLIDCADPECGLDPACKETNCSDLIDNDGDGFVDCADSDCAGSPDCPETSCDDGIDNDRDGRTDCQDSDCALDPACIETECSDGVDNDGDTLVDCGDPDCDVSPNCLPEEICEDGTDNDGDGDIDCDDIDCVAHPACEDADTDGDTVPNVVDCSPLDPGAHHVPLPPVPLMVIKPGISSTVAILTWTDMAAQAGSAVVYDVGSGRISELWDDDGIIDTDGDGLQIGCISQGRLIPLMADARRAPPSDGYYYLVVARNVCGDSGWGEDSFGIPREAPAGLCGTP